MRDDRERPGDILDAIAAIQRHLPKNQADFDKTETTKSHILLQIQIIGEAASKLSPGLRQVHPEVPWRPVIRMRNIVAHVYFGIDWEQVWEIAKQDVPKLRIQIESILTSLPAPDPPSP
jgi:uncharacterized protein with HEPN domain